jgi:UDP-N-acetylmuramate--alanine ligase
MNLYFQHIKAIFFLGIGGIGMSAQARYFNHYGLEVYGYDKTQTELTLQLEKEGIYITYTDQLESIHQSFLHHSVNNSLVVYTPAIPSDNVIFNFFQQNRYTLFKRAFVLGKITEGYKTIAVAGTHGKTTTTTLISHLLKDAGISIQAFMGGISSNYNTNLILSKNAQYCVVEADEYDKSFLTLKPYMAVVTSTDADHLDIYENAENIRETYTQFAEKTVKDGIVFATEKSVFNRKIVNQKTYGINNTRLDITSNEIQFENGGNTFQTTSGKTIIENIKLNVSGLHNVENCTVAIAVALELGIPIEQIKKSIASYKGVKRRFEYIFKNKKAIYIDDYAHHPQELNAIISAVKSCYPEKQLTVIFQPHLYSRTRDFINEFALELSKVDQLAIMPIYPARELPIEGVNSEALLKKIRHNKKSLVPHEAILQYIENQSTELLLTVGAGDIDKHVTSIQQVFIQKFGNNELE